MGNKKDKAIEAIGGAALTGGIIYLIGRLFPGSGSISGTKKPGFTFDYSQLDPDEMIEIGASKSEIESLFFNPNTRYHETSKSRYHSISRLLSVIGYTNKGRFLTVFYNTKSKKSDISIENVFIPYEKEIQTKYCR